MAEKDEFTLETDTGKRFKEVIEAPVSDNEMTDHGKASTENSERGETWSNKLSKKGLHPFKNIDLICLFLYAFFVVFATILFELAFFKSSCVCFIVGSVFLPANLLADKGDIATIIRQILFGNVRKLAKKSEEKHDEQSKFSIWERTGRK